MGCGDVIDVGKIVDTTEAGDSQPMQFGGWRDQTTSRWLAGTDLWRVLERWHIVHRGHEVRLVSEPFLDEVDPEGQLHYCDSAEEILKRAVESLPDDVSDASQMPGEVADRLRAHVGASRKR